MILIIEQNNKQKKGRCKLKKNQFEKKKFNLLKQEKGITLIALVITIIVLLILAGVSISALTGDSSILGNAKNTVHIYNNRVEQSDTKISNLEQKLNNFINGNIEVPGGQNPDLEEGTPLITTATNYQSTTKTFVDSLDNEIVVPGGFKVRTDFATTADKGIVIEDSSGNQFVWVPIGTITKSDNTTVNIEFGRYSDFSLTATPAQYASEGRWNALTTIGTYFSEVTTYRTSTYASRLEESNATAKDLATFISNALDNGGYYLARYEASFGSGDQISSVTNGSTSAGSAGITNQKPSFKQSTSASSSGEIGIGTITSTPGMLWNFIRQGDASLACQNLYEGNEYNGQDFVECDLVNSYAWDTAIMFIQKCSDKTDYANQSNYNGTLYNTGTDTGKTTDKACNIYDMAGNLTEWTTESSSRVNWNQMTCVYRGGCYCTSFWTAGREGDYASYASYDRGFRAVLDCAAPTV